MTRTRIEVIPVTFPTANRWVARLHRHHGALPIGFAWFCCAAVADTKIVGVAIAGRPTNRNNDDGQTIEVLRLATDGTDNAPSALLGACARAAKALGAWRIITYILETETGSSLKAAGWKLEQGNIKSKWTYPRAHHNVFKRDHFEVPKARWGLTFRSPLEVAEEPSQTAGQPDLFGNEREGSVSV